MRFRLGPARRARDRLREAFPETYSFLVTIVPGGFGVLMLCPHDGPLPQEAPFEGVPIRARYHVNRQGE